MTSISSSFPSPRDLRLEKDPNLKLDFFWDLRKDRLPLFRALQMTKFIVKSNKSRSQQDDGHDKESVAILLVDRIPSKYEVHNMLKKHPESMRIVYRNATSKIIQLDNDICNSYPHQQLVSAKEQDGIYICKSAAASLLCSTLVSENDNNEFRNMAENKVRTKEEPLPLINTHVSTKSKSNETWFRIGLPRATPQYALFYKKRGILCTCKRGPYDSVFVPTIADVLDKILIQRSSTSNDNELIDKLRPLVPVGRLDLESEGLILLTNDGTFSRFCTSPAVGLKKIYRVLVKSKGRRGWTPTGNSLTGHEQNQQTSRRLLAELQKRLSEIADRVQVKAPGGPAVPRNANVSPQSADDAMDSPTEERHRLDQSTASSPEFRAESCVIVDLKVDETCKYHRPRNPQGHGCRVDDDQVESDSRPTMIALIDVEMREGAKREVRRLMRSIDFVTLMLVRTQIGELDWHSLSVANADPNAPQPWDFRVPQTVPEALDKCQEYHARQTNHKSKTRKDESSRVQQDLEAAACSKAFRYLGGDEVDRIFSIVDVSDFHG